MLTQNKTRMNILHWPANYLLVVLHACLGKYIMFPSGPVQVTALLTSGHITHSSVTTGKHSAIQLSCYSSQHRSEDMHTEPSMSNHRKCPESRLTVWELDLLAVTTVIVSLNKALNLWWLQRDCSDDKMTNIKQTKRQRAISIHKQRGYRQNPGLTS